jgi:hypothetical protein
MLYLQQPAAERRGGVVCGIWVAAVAALQHEYLVTQSKPLYTAFKALKWVCGGFGGFGLCRIAENTGSDAVWVLASSSGRRCSRDALSQSKSSYMSFKALK